MKLFKLAPIVVVLVACGGGEPAETGQPDAAPTTESPAPAAPAAPEIPSGDLTVPDWYQVDHGAQTVHMTITAGSTPDNNYWNYNGAINGEWAITVPEGYTVTIDLVNEDPNMPHSLGITSELTNFMAVAPDPVFEGAMTQNPQSMVDATMPGETETITFVAGEEGDYSMVCFIPGHSAVGMWLYFTVAEGQDAGVAGM